MKTLSDIIDEVKDGGKPEYDELRYALLVSDAIDILLFNFVLMDLYGKDKLQGFDKMRFEQQYKSRQTAFNTDPKKYIGSFDPDLPEYQRQREVSKRIFDKFVKAKEQPKQEKGGA